jgi:hypothetical protein
LNKFETYFYIQEVSSSLLNSNESDKNNTNKQQELQLKKSKQSTDRSHEKSTEMMKTNNQKHILRKIEHAEISRETSAKIIRTTSRQSSARKSSGSLKKSAKKILESHLTQTPNDLLNKIASRHLPRVSEKNDLGAFFLLNVDSSSDAIQFQELKSGGKTTQQLDSQKISYKCKFPEGDRKKLN